MNKLKEYEAPITPTLTGWYWGTIEVDVLGNPENSRFCYWDGSMWWKALGWKSEGNKNAFRVGPFHGLLNIPTHCTMEPATILRWSGLHHDNGLSSSLDVKFCPHLDYRLCTGKKLIDGKVVNPA